MTLIWILKQTIESANFLPRYCFELSDCFRHYAVIDYLHLSPAEALAKQAITIEVLSDERRRYKTHFEVAKFIADLKKSFSESTDARSYEFKLEMNSSEVECEEPFD
uniref:Uncharacterized protein n=1 Tax=Ditylenchus dipsaci TaxID=166011 RepID=A0A915D2P2_9BILA